MEDIIEDIKNANSIETVVAKLGYKFDRDHGDSRRVSHVGGLVVNTKEQKYFWASKGWNGDVVDLVMKHEGLEFQEAVVWLADLAGVERPNWGKVDRVAIAAARAKENAFDIAQRVFARWLQEDAEALAYVRGRGLTDKGIAESRIGFSGRGTDAYYKDMRGDFSLYGVDATSPAAVAVLGFRGDVLAWAAQYGLDSAKLDQKWIERGWISGMLSTPGVVYAHYYGKRLVYFSRRHLPGHDRIKTEDGTEREWKSWNPPVAIIGERAFYFNHAWRADAQECLVVEGQMDAITLALWGLPGVALCGLGSSPDALAWLRDKLSKHLVVYLALDDDKAGQEKVRKLGMVFGPMTRIVRWPKAQAPQAEQEPEEPEEDNGASLYVEALGLAREAMAEGKKVGVSLFQRQMKVTFYRAKLLHGQVMETLQREAEDTPPGSGETEEGENEEPRHD